MRAKKYLQLHYYYFQIYIALDGGAKEKRDFLTGLRDNINDYLAEFPQTEMKTLRDYFGEPAFIANAFRESSDRVANRRALRKRIWKTILWTLLGLLVLFAIFFLVLYLMQQITIPTYLK